MDTLTYSAVMEQKFHDLHALDFVISRYSSNTIKLYVRFTSHYKSKA